MKKFKLFALTALFCAMGSNAFAHTEPTWDASQKSATSLFTFQYVTNGGEGSEKVAMITGFVAELNNEFKAAVAIPDSVTDAADPTKKYHVVAIAAGAFKNQPITTISFYTKKAKAANSDLGDQWGVEFIGAGAFEGTNLTELDLTKTTIATVNNLFGTKIDMEDGKPTKKDVVNSKIATVKLPETWTSIAGNAFANCTALATVDFGTPATSVVSQAISAGAFAGCPLTALDLSKTKVTSLITKTLYDGVKFAASAVQTVTVGKDFTAFNGNLTGDESLTAVTGFGAKGALVDIAENEFKGCKALATISTTYVKSFGANCFENCSALTSVDFTSVTAEGIGQGAFVSSGLTSVTFPATVLTTIPSKAFWQCTNLATVTLSVDKDKKSAIATIGPDAFGYTGITSFTIPATTVKMNIGAKAFAGTPLTDFTWAPDAAYDKTNMVIAMDAFSRCSNVAFHTTQKFAEGSTTPATDGFYVKESTKAPNGPTNTTFDYNTDPAETKFTTTAYKSNSSKYYVKWYNASKDIAVKKGEGKVYAAYLEGDGSLAMMHFKADAKGYYQIQKGDVALIITDNADLAYIAGDGSTTSWVNKAEAYNVVTNYKSSGYNVLKYVTAATTRAALESAVDEDYYIYGWVNSASACGFQKITSGTNINKDVLFIYAKEPAAGGRLNVKWYDENGNLEDETTAIQGVEAAQAEDAEIYNLQGVRVSGAKKGLYIKNGKKFIVK